MDFIISDIMLVRGTVGC